MSEPRRPLVHVVVGNPHAGGRTTQVGLTVAAALREVRPDLDTELIELADHTASMFDRDDVPLADLVERVVDGAALVVASPTYKASFTGLLKAFLDRFDAGSLTGVTTVPVMLGAEADHALAVETQLRPVLVELGATMPTSGLYVIDSAMDRVGALVDRWLVTHRDVLTAQLVTSGAGQG